MKKGRAAAEFGYALAVLLSNIQASCLLFGLAWARIKPRDIHGGRRERRHNPRSCCLCAGPMKSDRRGPRDVRRPDGSIKRLPEETLHWYRCGRCSKSQIGY